MGDDSPLLAKVSAGEHEEEEKMTAKHVVLFKKRWLMMSLLFLITVNSLLQWIFYSAVTETIQRFFNVPLYAVEYLTISGMIVTIVFLVPCVWVVHRTSLRTSCLINCTLNTIAALMKYFACYAPNSTGYSVTLIGQIVMSIATCLVLPMPAQLAAAWFGSNERSTATAVVASGHFVGISSGCFLSTVLVAGNMDFSTTQARLEYGQLCQVVLSFTLTIAAYALFRSEPPTPPSKSQAMLDVYNLRLPYKESLKTLLTNLHYCLFLVAYGTIGGAMFAFWMITQETLPTIYHGKQYDIGMIGAVTGLFGVPGIFLSGVWLDKTKTYKSSLVTASFLIVIVCVAYTVQLKFSHSLLGIYITCALFGLLVSSFMSMGFVFVGEITYPVPETVSSGLLLVSEQTIGTALASAASLVNEHLHDGVVSSSALTCAIFMSSALVVLVNTELKRYAEDVTNNNHE